MTPWTIWFKPAEAETWHPLELYRSLAIGHYRLAACFPQSFKRLDWRWKFYPQIGEIQYYDFHGQTNADGLISLLDLNTVRPGTWQLIGRPDVFDELCGETWQIEHQFQIIPSLASALIIPPLSPSPIAADMDSGVNDIVPHPPTPADDPTESLDTVTALANQIDSPAIAPANPLALEPVMTKTGKTQFSGLAEPDFVPEIETLTAPNHLRSINYLLELVDPERAATYQVDITVMLDDRRPAVPLDLPNPRQMVRLLHRPIPKPKSPLPPKLTKV
ncbi:MAG: hypothetical protein RLZZ490_929 [Cyanobacteriota bacterium]|jgi:hypothetical protein